MPIPLPSLAVVKALTDRIAELTGITPEQVLKEANAIAAAAPPLLATPQDVDDGNYTFCLYQGDVSVKFIIKGTLRQHVSVEAEKYVRWYINPHEHEYELSYYPNNLKPESRELARKPAPPEIYY